MKHCVYQKLGVGLLFLSSIVSLSGCGPKAFTKGEYGDVNEVELLDDKFNTADMQQMAETAVTDILTSPVVMKAGEPPVVMVDKIVNHTEEHIDTVAILNKTRTALIKSGKVRFVSREDRGTLSEEYDYSDAGNVSAETANKRGHQIGAQFILSGYLSSNVQTVGNNQVIDYIYTLNMVNTKKGTIDAVSEKQIRKKFRKRSIGL